MVRISGELRFSLYCASMAISRAYKPMLDALGLTYPQYLVLHALWEQDGRTVGAIAERLGLESSTITPLVKRLESAGLAARARKIRDECGCLGEELLARSGMTGEQLGKLNRRVQALRDAVAA